MDKRETLELRMLTRNIVHVIEYFDEAPMFPWSYVERKQGRFEGFTTILVYGESGDEAVPVSVGVFSTIAEAAHAVRVYDGWLDAMSKLAQRQIVENLRDLLGLRGD